MSPKEAKIFLVEDDSKWQHYNRMAVEGAGHHIVVEVSDVNEGLKAVPQAKELGVNIALLDGKIPYFSDDGAKLAAALRAAIPGIKVVDVSAFGDAVKDAEAKMPKLKFSIDGLGKLVTEL